MSVIQTIIAVLMLPALWWVKVTTVHATAATVGTESLARVSIY